MDSPPSAKFCKYIINHHKQEVLEILKNPDENGSFSIIINFLTLFEEDIDLGNGLLAKPEKYLSEFNSAAVLAQKCVLEDLKDSGEYKAKPKVFIRITALPVFDETSFPSNDDIGSFVKINGTLIKVGSPKLLEYQRDYLCKKCHHINKAYAQYERYYAITAPTKCEECHSNSITLNKEMNPSYFRDYQEVKVQEHFGRSKVGTVPHSMWVTLENNLVDTCKPGDDVAITGIVSRRWRPFKVDMRYDIDLALKANNLEICNEPKSIASSEEVKESFVNFWQYYKHQELVGRNHILKSFCPQIFGMYLAKLAMVIVLAGGVQKVDENGCSARGVSHLLLVGDAGTGKSHLLRYASKISGRSVFTTGVGSTTAGLTVSAVRENGDWNLEAGALVLADGGICCIDDFSTIREHDRTSIHEAMEQQSISVAKAGIVTKLHTRCSIFATTAPKGKYDCSIPMTVNVGISSPLLSRFDIVLILLDSKSAIWDKSLCDFIFNGGRNPSSSQEALPPSSRRHALATANWSTDNIKNYFSVVKRINPSMSQDAGTVLRVYYQTQRSADSRNAARTTVRLLESLIREWKNFSKKRQVPSKQERRQLHYSYNSNSEEFTADAVQNRNCGNTTVSISRVDADGSWIAGCKSRRRNGKMTEAVGVGECNPGQLSQGHARLMYRNTVTVLDAVVAITLVESSMQSASFSTGVNALHTVFPEDPYAEYKSQMETILTKLNLREILDREMEEVEKARMELLAGKTNGENTFVEADFSEDRGELFNSSEKVLVSTEFAEMDPDGTKSGSENEEARRKNEERPREEHFGVCTIGSTEKGEMISSCSLKTSGKRIREEEEDGGSRWGLPWKRTLSDGPSDDKITGEETLKEKNIFSTDEDDSWSDLDL